MTDKQLQEVATKLGVIVTMGYNGRAYEVEAFAPINTVFASNYCHTIVESVYTNPAIARKAMAESLSYGLQDCENIPDCDYCNDETILALISIKE